MTAFPIRSADKTVTLFFKYSNDVDVFSILLWSLTSMEQHVIFSCDAQN